MDFLTALQGLLTIENGIFLIGWVLAGYLLIQFLANKNSLNSEMATLRNAHDEELRKIRVESDRRIDEETDELNTDLRTAYDKIQNLHAHHLEMISAMAEKRIADIKEVVEDYNAMAESTMAALDKLTQAIASKPKRRSSDD